jgi:hypothetical protein
MSTGVQPPANPDPLRETSRYTKVADLSHGSFGFVQLARNTETQELVAIKFIERGDRVNRCASSRCSSNSILRRCMHWSADWRRMKQCIIVGVVAGAMQLVSHKAVAVGTTARCSGGVWLTGSSSTRDG